MHRRWTTVMVLAVFSAGLLSGLAIAKKKNRVDPALYRGKTSEQAALALADKALEAAGKGSWERISVARALYLGGKKDRALAIIDGIKKPERSDWKRIGRMYFAAGELDKGVEMFRRVLGDKYKDDDTMYELAAHLNASGRREEAEDLLEKATQLDHEDVYGLAWAAGSYLGVTPGG